MFRVNIRHRDGKTEVLGHYFGKLGTEDECQRCGKSRDIISPILPPIDPPEVESMDEEEPGTSTYDLNGAGTVLASTETSTYSHVYNGGSLNQRAVVTQTTANGQTTTATHTLDFIYDASGSPVAVTYDGTTYYYALNLQGDVLAILDGSGNRAVSYTYDAWGNVQSVTGTMASTLGQYNPLRYRGYVYDTETESYYLQSRYYNPGLGRFLNADAFTSTGQGLLGNNMFTYCLNNPVVCIDETGAAAKTCISAEGNIDNAPWRNVSPSGGGRPRGNYSSGNSYGSAADKFYTVRLIKFVANTDEQVVLDAKYLAFYKGVPVLKLDWMGTDAFSFGMIFMGNDVKYRSDAQFSVQHEYGHAVHYRQIGVVNYTLFVAIPSVTGYWLRVPTEKYYSQPWEYVADCFGGVQRTWNNNPYPYAISDFEAVAYWIYSFVA